MLVFGHTGITLGVAMLLAGLTASSRSNSNKEFETISYHASSSSATTESPNGFKTHNASWVEYLAGYADLRLLLVGSLLPDIIDKPVGQFFFRETFSNGRIFSHTLFFLVIITVVGFYLYRRSHQTWLQVLSFGTFTHLVLDQMWRTPQTLLWPAYGFAFAKVDLTNWVPNMFRALLSEPHVYVPELVGVVILVWFAQLLVRRRKVSDFLRYGKV